MTQTDNYGLNIVEGSDLVNPLTQANPNFEKIDEQMKLNSERGITTATELKAGNVHALTRLDGDVAVFRFTATTNYVAGETFTVDGVQVTALLTTGQQLSTGAYIIGSEVLCVLKGTLLTFVISGATNALDSEKLGGELPNYYAKESDLNSVRETGIATAETATKNAQDIQSLNASLMTKYIPNYANTQRITTFPYTAPVNGQLTLIFTYSEYIESRIYVNGRFVNRFRETPASGWNVSSVSLVLGKGDVVSYTGFAPTVGSSENDVSIFIPFK